MPDVIRGIVDDPAFRSLEVGLEAASLRQKALAQNVANADTPGYKRQDVAFAGRLAGLLDPGGQKGRLHQREPEPRIVVESSTSGRSDGNNVEIESEMALMAENSLWYQAMARIVSEKLSRLRMAISEGRR